MFLIVFQGFGRIPADPDTRVILSSLVPVLRGGIGIRFFPVRSPQASGKDQPSRNRCGLPALLLPGHEPVHS
ncbi:hypothetical protein ASZ90_016314 [hydrocarbon metagenome]|uniref:Uncharacterized protein n=1 Tax=hydrocarbon metagenome TaxID=938273 RepID=A0A0W8EZJ2_9ZZZZ